MPAYLAARADDLARSQFRSPRRARPTGLTVLHTAESVLDTVGPDTGAEAVARYMVSRDTPGSYHDLVDSDSALQLVEYGDEAYQDGTGTNPYALSISFALRTTDWAALTLERRARFLVQGAAAFARQQAWLRARGYPTTPLRRITRAQSEDGAAGFITHADRDPGRRSDPGAAFPWAAWLAACAAATAPPVTPEENPPMTEDDRKIAAGRHTQLAAELTAQRGTLQAVERTVDATLREQRAQGATLRAIEGLLTRLVEQREG